jgi:hypothetical protein
MQYGSVSSNFIRLFVTLDLQPVIPYSWWQVRTDPNSVVRTLTNADTGRDREPSH